MPTAESVAEGPAITALGPLFRLTEVFLWDDAVIDFSEASARCRDEEEPAASSCIIADTHSSLNQGVCDYTSVEDLELAQEMNALGLPISFTAKEKKNGAKRQPKKGTRLRYVSAGKNTDRRVPEVSVILEHEDVTSSSVLHDRTNILPSRRIGEGQCETSQEDLEVENDKCDMHSVGDSINLLTTIHSESSKEQYCDRIDLMTSCVSKETIPYRSDSARNAEITENPTNLDVESNPSNVEEGSTGTGQEVHLFNKNEATFAEGSSVSCGINKAKNSNVDITTSEPVCSFQIYDLMNNQIQDYPDNSICYEFGDWKVVWDTFYKRNYFYNCQTEDSTWHPPRGLEHFAFSCGTSDEQAVAGEAKENSGSRFTCDAIPDEDTYSSLDRADSFQGNRYNEECIEHSSQELSSIMDVVTCLSVSGVNILATNVPVEHLDKQAEARAVSDEQGSPLISDVKNCTTDELDGRVYLDKQRESGICFEAWSPFDISLDVPINDSGLPDTSVTSVMDELDSHHEIVTSKKKKRPRRLQSYKKKLSATKCELMSEGVTGGVSMNIMKYWCQRYLLFSRFDHGIKMDEEGWFSVTPESIARHHASRCGSGTVIDCFTGVGGNAIQFAMRSNHVIAIDIDTQKIEYAQHNAAIYGVSNKIDFINGNFLHLAPCLKGTTIFMSPPWGGPDYAKKETYDITSMLKPVDGHHLFKTGRMIASRVILFLPRNVDVNQLAELSLSVNPPWTLEVEKNFVNGRLKAITAYFSNEAV